MTTNGWELRGSLLQEQRQVLSRTNCALDFSLAPLVTITPSAAALSYYVTNQKWSGDPNFESRVFSSVQAERLYEQLGLTQLVDRNPRPTLARPIA